GLVVHGAERALVKILRWRVVSGTCKPVGDAADLVVESPSFLDHDDAWAALSRGREIALGLAPVGTRKLDHAHGRSPLLALDIERVPQRRDQCKPISDASAMRTMRHRNCSTYS